MTYQQYGRFNNFKVLPKIACVCIFIWVNSMGLIAQASQTERFFETSEWKNWRQLSIGVFETHPPFDISSIFFTKRHTRDIVEKVFVELAHLGLYEYAIKEGGYGLKSRLKYDNTDEYLPLVPLTKLKIKRDVKKRADAFKKNPYKIAAEEIKELRKAYMAKEPKRKVVKEIAGMFIVVSECEDFSVPDEIEVFEPSCVQTWEEEGIKKYRNYVGRAEIYAGVAKVLKGLETILKAVMV